MANPGTNNLALVEARFTWNGQEVENRLHFRHDAAPSPSVSQLEALLGYVDERIINDWLPLMATTVTYRECYAETYAGASSIAATLLGTGAGTASGESLPGNSTLCLSLRSASVGRSRRGRFYTIGMTEGQQTGGVVTTGYRNAWLTTMSALLGATIGDDWYLCVASFISGGVARETGFLTDVTQVITVNDFVDSQRRRLQGRGR